MGNQSKIIIASLLIIISLSMVSAWNPFSWFSDLFEKSEKLNMKVVSSPDSTASPSPSSSQSPTYVPVNGLCGSSLNTCTRGVFVDVTDSDYRYWKCQGTNGGTTASCQTALPATSPASSPSGSPSQTPEEYLKNPLCGRVLNTCINGTFLDVVDNSTDYKWKCKGRTLINCTLPKIDCTNKIINITSLSGSNTMFVDYVASSKIASNVNVSVFINNPTYVFSMDCPLISSGCSSGGSSGGSSDLVNCRVESDCMYSYLRGVPYFAKVESTSCKQVFDVQGTNSIPVEDLKCNDSDGGLNEFEYSKIVLGTAWGDDFCEIYNNPGGYTQVDSCKATDNKCSVREKYCDKNAPNGIAGIDISCKNGCSNGACLKSEPSSCNDLFTFGGLGNNRITMTVETSSGIVNIPLLYGSAAESKYLGYGKDSTHRLKTSMSNTLELNEKENPIFIASYSYGGISESHIFQLININRDSDTENVTTIKDMATGKLYQFVNNDDIDVGEITLKISNPLGAPGIATLSIWHNGLSKGVSMNEIYDKNGNYVILDKTFPVPMSLVTIDIYSNSRNMIKQYTANFVGGMATVSLTSDLCSAHPDPREHIYLFLKDYPPIYFDSYEDGLKSDYVDNMRGYLYEHDFVDGAQAYYIVKKNNEKKTSVTAGVAEFTQEISFADFEKYIMSNVREQMRPGDQAEYLDTDSADMPNTVSLPNSKILRWSSTDGKLILIWVSDEKIISIGIGDEEFIDDVKNPEGNAGMMKLFEDYLTRYPSTLIENSHPECNGCFLDNKCYPYGFRTDGKYCRIDGKFVIQTGNNGNCENNFECSSNFCLNNQCVSQTLIERLLELLRKIFGPRITSNSGGGSSGGISDGSNTGSGGSSSGSGGSNGGNSGSNIEKTAKFKQSCMDSDGKQEGLIHSINYQEKGTVSIWRYNPEDSKPILIDSRTDVCTYTNIPPKGNVSIIAGQGRYLVEFYCNDTEMKSDRFIDCGENGCINGACPNLPNYPVAKKTIPPSQD